MSGTRNRKKGSNHKKGTKNASQTPPAPALNSATNSDTEAAHFAESRTKCTKVVSPMHELGFTLDTFLHDLIYGNPEARNVPSLKKARRDLRQSPLLPTMLNNLHTPPRANSEGKQAGGADTPLESWANATMDDIYRKGLLEFSKSTRCNIEELVDDEKLKELTFNNLFDAVKAICPRLLDTLLESTKGTRQEEGRQTEQDSTFISFVPDIAA